MKWNTSFDVEKKGLKVKTFGGKGKKEEANDGKGFKKDEK